MTTDNRELIHLRRCMEMTPKTKDAFTNFARFIREKCII